MSDPPCIELATRTGSACHWTPEDALREAQRLLEEHGGRTLIVAFVDEAGAIQIGRAGLDHRIALLAQKVALAEINDHEIEP